ncbi:MAG: polysaccharide pyruvyl transferase CsaB [Candidatus Acetothermia bacterium]
MPNQNGKWSGRGANSGYWFTLLNHRRDLPLETADRITISGYYGFGNLGDEAILDSIVSSIRDRFGSEEPEVVVLSNAPKKTESEHGVRAVNRWGVLGLIRTIRKTDVLISGGGGLFQDRTSSLSLWYYLGIIYLARLLDVPVYVVGQGIGPVNRRYNEYLLSRALSGVEGFLVRDDRSLKVLKSLGVDGSRVKQGSDLAFLLDRKREDREDFLPQPEDDIVAAALRDDVEGRTDVLRAVSSGLEMLHEEYGVTIVLFSSESPADRQLNSDLQSYTDAPTKVLDVDHLSPIQLIDMMEDLDLVIAGRLHTLIFSFISGVPVQGISYDPKMDSLIEEINESYETPDFSLWHPEELIEGTEYLSDLKENYENREKLKSAAGRVGVRMAEKAEQGMEVTLDWIEEELNDQSETFRL